MMLILQPQTIIEPLHTSPSFGYKGRLVREVNNEQGVGEEGVVKTQTITSLLESQMFREQHNKLQWISNRIERFVVVYMISVGVRSNHFLSNNSVWISDRIERFVVVYMISVGVRSLSNNSVWISHEYIVFFVPLHILTDAT